jgi:hypothetical protein
MLQMLLMGLVGVVLVISLTILLIHSARANKGRGS